ncbi:MAG: hypothetical protein HRU30_09680 [Rhodobacteraceae bacterium]|nr:hypothetical protein [Paracoccaceae bacterium]
MTEQKLPLWMRGVLALLALIIFAFTLPAYANPTSNPGLAILTGEAATLGSLAGAFLGRQLTLALIAGFGAMRGTATPMMIGAFGIGFFNLHDAVFLSLFGAGGPGAIAGLILGVVGLGLMLLIYRRTAA